MIAISTIQSILRYKQKYSAIGQAPNATPGDDLNEVLKKYFGDTGETMISDLNDAFKSLKITVADSNVGLSKFTKIQEDLNSAIVGTVKQMTLLEERESDLTSTFKVGTQELALRSKAFNSLQTSISATSDEMASYRAILEKTSELSGKLFASDVKIGSTIDKDGNEQAIMGINTYIQRQMVANQYLSRNTDLTDDNAASLQLYAAGAGRSLDEQVLATKALAESYGDVISESTSFEIISQEIAGLTSDVRQQYSKIPGNLELAVLKSKQLGVSMAQLSKTGESLLDIESSVGKEIEYQLLSGKRLVDQQGKSITNQYRAATLSGDAVKQADLLKQVYVTQNDVLSGNNILAKKALADSLGMSTQDLMNMYEKQKLQEQIADAYAKTGKTGPVADIDELLKDPKKMEKFKFQLEKSKSEDDKDLLNSIKALEEKAETRRSPAEKIQIQLQSIIDQGLNVKIIASKLKTAREEGKSYEKAVTGLTGFLKEPQVQKAVGGFQLKSSMGNTVGNAGASTAKGIPIIGGVLGEGVKAVNKFQGKLTGTPMEGSTKKTSKDNGKIQKKGDAIIGINDGIIQFNDRDKLTVVASPFGTMNEKVADKITNPVNAAGPSIDMNSIVTAIQSALGNINITVALDPMAIDKEIKFRQGSLNS